MTSEAASPNPLRLTPDALAAQVPLAIELGDRFADAGFELALVGGTVRDLLLGREISDLDFTTNAHPEQIKPLVSGWADDIWDVGARFGTIGANKDEFQIEITTYRTESYAHDSRKPEVAYGDTLAGDVERRDFTINAMAIKVPEIEFVDQCGGIPDLMAGMLRTPGTPEQSFSDDPLRMLRAARFAAQLNFEVAPEVLLAMREMGDRLEIVSAERIRDEFNKLILSDNPRRGIEILVATKLIDYIAPEIPALALEIDEHHHHKDVYEHSIKVLEQAIDLEQSHEPNLEPDLVLRLAALFHDIGKPKTRKFEPGGSVSFHHHEVVGAKMVRKRMQALRYPKDTIDRVSHLVALHLRFHGYSGGTWTDSAVRRYARDAGDELTRLHKLTRADCTTRNKRKATALRESYDSLEARIAELEEQEELKAVRPDLNGAEIMAILGLSEGREVGEAYKFLLERRLDRGPVEPEEAEAELREWWAARQ